MDELIENVREAVALHYEGTDEHPEVLLLTELVPDYAANATG